MTPDVVERGAGPAATPNVVERGAGPAVVCLHSGGMSARQWTRLTARLSRRFRTLAVDFLGCGDSPPAPAGFTVQDDLDAALSVIDAEAEPVHLVGHSYGGVIALWAARRRPERVRTLSLCEPVAFGVLHSARDAAGIEEIGGDPAFGLEGGSEAWLRAFIGYWNGPGAWDALPKPTREAFARVGPKVYLEVAGINADRTSHEQYGEVQAPTLLVYGERTTYAARRVAQILHGVLRGSELHVVAGAGHMHPLTHGDEVDAAIERHLLRHP